jgi:Flp pilus assembly protein TadD
LLMSEGHFQQALTQFNVAYSTNPVFPALNKNLGTLLLRLGENAQAAHFLERARSFGRADGDLYALLGETYINLGQLSAAQRTLQSALKLFAETPINGDDEVRQKKIAWIRESLHHLEQGTGRESSVLGIQEELPAK